MLNNPTIEELEEKYEQLQAETEKIRAIIDASDTSTFEIFIEQIKEEMIDNVKEEDFKTLKQNKNKVEKFREIIKIIQNQTKLLETKTNEMNDLKWKIDHFQQTLPLYEQSQEAENTGFSLGGAEISTGDIYKDTVINADDKRNYYLVKKSAEIANSFAIISNGFEGERCLQYPNNFKILDGTFYVGNIYIDNEDHAGAVEALSIIADSQKTEETDCEQSAKQSEDTVNERNQE